MRFAAIDRILHNKKATRVTTGVNEPSRREGSNGDITIRNIKGRGVFLFVKYNNNWYARGLFDGPAEIGMTNPGREFQLYGWNPDQKAYTVINTNDVMEIVFGSPGQASLKLGTSGAVALNEVASDTDLTDTTITSYAVETSVIKSGKTLTVGSGVEFDVVALDPSADEEVRIDKRLRFDAETAYSLANLHTKVDWLEEEVVESTRKKFNNLIDGLGGINHAKLVGYNQVNDLINYTNGTLEQTNRKPSLSVINSKIADINSNIAIIKNALQSLAAGNTPEELPSPISPISVSDLSAISPFDTLGIGESLFVYDYVDGADSYKIPKSRNTIGGTWSFDFTGGAHEDLWTSSEAHGLSAHNRVLFITGQTTPSEYSTYVIYKVIYRSSTTIQLRPNNNAYPYLPIEGTADSAALSYYNLSTWQMVYALNDDGTRGSLPYSTEYDNAGAGHNMKPDLVTDETYTSGGVCSLSQYHTRDACTRGGGTWYPLETINDNT